MEVAALELIDTTKNLINIDAFSLDRVLEMEFLSTTAEHEDDPAVSSSSTRYEGEPKYSESQVWI